MKIVDGSIAKLPNNVHVEQDGNLFFILTQPRVDGAPLEQAMAVIDCEMPVPFRMTITDEDRAIQSAVRAYLTAMDVNPTFDY